MTSLNTAKHRKVLMDEFALLERELGSVGRINPENKDDWEPMASELNAGKAEIEEVAAQITDFEDRSSIEFELEERFNRVKAALESIESGTYGVCRICGKAIEEERLDANAAATTCKEHKDR